MFSSKVLSPLGCLTVGTSLFSLVQSGTVFAAAKDKDSGNVGKVEGSVLDRKKAEPAIIEAVGEYQPKTQISPEKPDSKKDESMAGSGVVSNKENPKKGAEAEKSSDLQNSKGVVCFTAKSAKKDEDFDARFLFSVLLFVLLLPFRLAFSIVWSIIKSILVVVIGLPLVAVFCALTFLIDGSDGTFLTKSKRSLVFMGNFFVCLLRGILNGNTIDNLKEFYDKKVPGEYKNLDGRFLDSLKKAGEFLMSKTNLL